MLTSGHAVPLICWQAPERVTGSLVLASRSKDATRGSWHRYCKDATRGSLLVGRLEAASSLAVPCSPHESKTQKLNNLDEWSMTKTRANNLMSRMNGANSYRISLKWKWTHAFSGFTVDRKGVHQGTKAKGIGFTRTQVDCCIQMQWPPPLRANQTRNLSSVKSC